MMVGDDAECSIIMMVVVVMVVIGWMMMEHLLGRGGRRVLGRCHTWDISLMYPQSTNVSLPIIISNMRNGQT